MDWFLEDEDCGTAYELDCECGNDCDLDFYEKDDDTDPLDLPERPSLHKPKYTPAYSPAPKMQPQPEKKPEKAPDKAPKRPALKTGRKELAPVALASAVITAVFLLFAVIRFLVC